MPYIHPFSRYRNERLRLTPHKSGEPVLAMTFPLVRMPELPAGERVYTPVDGQHVDTIAIDVYGTPFLWHLIALRNPSLTWPLDLVPGDPLSIPPAEVTEAGY